MGMRPALQKQNHNPDQAQGPEFLCPSYTFTTADLPRRCQFSAYAREVATLRDVCLSDERQPEDGFSATHCGYIVNGLHVVFEDVDEHSFCSPCNQQRLSSDRGWILIMRMSGWADIERGGRRVHFGKGSVEVRRLGAALSGCQSDASSMLVYLPRGRLAGLEFRLDSLAEAGSGASIHPQLGFYLAAMARALRRLPTAEAAALEQSTLAMIRSSIVHCDAPSGSARVPIMETRFEVARRYVEANLARHDLSAEDIASYLRMSRRQVYKLFKAQGGVQRYIRKARLDACFHDILNSGDKRTAAQIAEAYGFGDLAAFVSHFKSRFGVSPSQLVGVQNSKREATAYDAWLEKFGAVACGSRECNIQSGLHTDILSSRQRSP